ncbi:MAG: rhomboid family intramembrane serine protease [Gammaproteobacteria bacterium]|nr:rhomboid family intramembrane serine protease [Gammaproteobacteria bacterium]
MIPIHDDNPTRRVPVVTIALIISCSLVFLWELTTPLPHDRLVYGLGVTPAVLFGVLPQATHYYMVPAWMTIFTSMFMHGGWLHLLGNMLFLWIFGNNVEDRLGHTRYLVFYLLCGVIAVLANALPNIKSTVPMIGASGAIAGILGAYLVLFPRARVLVIIPIFLFITSVWWPAWVVLAIWFALQILSSLLTESGRGGIAFGAHIGGFLAGMVLILFFTGGRRRGWR